MTHIRLHVLGLRTYTQMRVHELTWGFRNSHEALCTSMRLPVLERGCLACFEALHAPTRTLKTLCINSHQATFNLMKLHERQSLETKCTHRRIIHILHTWTHIRVRLQNSQEAARTQMHQLKFLWSYMKVSHKATCNHKRLHELTTYLFLGGYYIQLRELT